MKRRAILVAILAPALGSLAQPAWAQFGVPWTRTPAITIVANGDDPRIALTREAVAFWNRTLEALGSGFRLGEVTRVDAPVNEEELQAVSQAIVDSAGRNRPGTPASLAGVQGDLLVLLARSEFISFAGPFDAAGRRIVGIRGLQIPPMTLPNVARNVIAHEIGHAIGLGHNADPKLLMCGRPAPCRPTEFVSREPRMFPLSDEEKQQLLRLYPRDWKPR